MVSQFDQTITNGGVMMSYINHKAWESLKELPLQRHPNTEEIKPLPLTKGDQHFEICKKLNETYRKKNADYGDSFDKLFQEYGELSAVIRLEDKHLRFKQLIQNPAQVKDESKIDTCLDAANYWIMTAMKLMERQNE